MLQFIMLGKEEDMFEVTNEVVLMYLSPETRRAMEGSRELINSFFAYHADKGDSEEVQGASTGDEIVGH